MNACILCVCVFWLYSMMHCHTTRTDTEQNKTCEMNNSPKIVWLNTMKRDRNIQNQRNRRSCAGRFANIRVSFRQHRRFDSVSCCCCCYGCFCWFACALYENSSRYLRFHLVVLCWTFFAVFRMSFCGRPTFDVFHPCQCTWHISPTMDYETWNSASGCIEFCDFYKASTWSIWIWSISFIVLAPSSPLTLYRFI